MYLNSAEKKSRRSIESCVHSEAKTTVLQRGIVPLTHRPQKCIVNVNTQRS